MRYSRNEVVQWAHRIAAGETAQSIASEYGGETRIVRRQFAAKGLARLCEYARGSAIPPPMDNGEPVAHPQLNEPPEQWEGMREFVGPHLKRAIDALVTHGSIEAAASSLMIAPGALRARLSEAKHISARRGWAPGEGLTKKTPPGFHVKGASTYYRVDPLTGEKHASGQWVKTDRDKEHRVQMLLDAVRQTMAGFEGAVKPSKAPAVDHKDYLAVYPMGDPHIGMFAWAEETGDDDHDLKAGEALLVGATESLVSIAPACEKALIINLGDFFHTDSKSNVTLRSHNPLDVDTRWVKILRVGIYAMIKCVDLALTKHREVHVICEIGNHDDHSALMLSVALDLYYRAEPRVTIDMSPGKFHWYRFQNNLIGVTHGDTAKFAELPGIMATDRRKDWGDTEHRYWYTGHVHHLQAKEYPGVLIESFRSLVPNDAYHSGAGYRSGRDMKLDLVHGQYGRSARHTIGVEEIRARKSRR